MLVGLKFCGGCRSGYDRGKASREIIEKAGALCTFEAIHEETEYETVVVISGCQTECADLSKIRTRGGFIKMCEKDMTDWVVRQLQDAAKQE